MGMLLCEQKFRDVWSRNESVGSRNWSNFAHTLTDTHTHTTAAKLVVRVLSSQPILGNMISFVCVSIPILSLGVCKRHRGLFLEVVPILLHAKHYSMLRITECYPNPNCNSWNMCEKQKFLSLRDLIGGNKTERDFVFFGEYSSNYMW